MVERRGALCLLVVSQCTQYHLGMVDVLIGREKSHDARTATRSDGLS
jgi:hypothetical protein